MSDNHEHQVSQPPQHPKTSGDTMTPSSEPPHDRQPVQGTSRDDMRRDTQRPDREAVGASNFARL
jgi:hypothetical protein